MATLEVRINYETRLSRICFWALSLLAPVWAVLPVLMWICRYYIISDAWFVEYHFLQDTVLKTFFASGLEIGSIPLFVTGLSSWFAFHDKRLVMSQQGICLPAWMILRYPKLLLARGGKTGQWSGRNLLWGDLKLVELAETTGSDQSYRQAKLLLTYESGGKIEIALDSLSNDDLEKLLLGVETFAESAKGIGCVSDLKRLVSDELKVKGIKSYTNLWEDELRYRYASTTFIPLSPGSSLQNGEIRVLRQLGFGGLSAIYLVQKRNKDLAVLKESVLPADVDETLKAKAEEQFEREARLLAGLNHPGIAKVLDHFVERGHYLLLEYIHGQDLRQHVNENGPLDEYTVVQYALQILEILDYLHSCEPAVIHRDLTPENLIVNEKGRVVLIDFGAANEFLHTATGTLVGKHAYMSPEQLKGRASVRSDLYSLGGTMYFLLTGKDPVPLSSSHPKLANVEVSQHLNDFVAALTHMNEKARPQSAQDAKDKLRLAGVS